MLGGLVVNEATAASRGSTSVSVAHKLSKAHRDLGTGERGAINNNPGSKLMRRVKVLGILSNAMHQGIAIIIATVLWLGSSASIDDTPVNLVVAGTLLGGVQVAGVATSLQAVDEGPPVRNRASVGTIVMFDGASLVHVTDTFVCTMLA